LAVDEVLVDEVSVDKMVVDEVSVDEMSIDELSVDDFAALISCFYGSGFNTTVKLVLILMIK
jgi:hypothetical protein